MKFHKPINSKKAICEATMSTFELAPTQSGYTATEQSALAPALRRCHIWNLYFSHALSTWNARIYEFAAVGRFLKSIQHARN